MTAGNRVFSLLFPLILYAKSIIDTQTRESPSSYL